MSTTKPISGFRHAQTRVGDTLQAIAAREMGDATRWYDIAQLNGLLPPYLTDDFAAASPSVLWAGQQTIKVPSSPPPASGVADPNSVFGTDIALTGGRLDVTETGDLRTVSGPANLTQALRNRLLTHTGDLTYHPAYGCDVYKLVGQGGTETTNRLAAAMVARALRSDRRVARVERATATVSGDRISATATAVSVDGKRVPTGIPLGPDAQSNL